MNLNLGLSDGQAHALSISSTTIFADDTTLMAESEEEVKSLLMKVKEESERAGLKLNIQKTKIRASVPITSWQMEGEIMETVTDFTFLGSKITADGYCSMPFPPPWDLPNPGLNPCLLHW